MEEELIMKTLSKTVLAFGLLGLSVGANAALVNGSVLNIGAGSGFEFIGYPIVQTITGFNGIVLGTTQSAAGDHLGPIDGTESPNIDQPWVFSGGTGMHSTLSPTNVLSASGNTASVDFSGWHWAWDGIIGGVPMGGGAWDGNPNGVALITCGVDCGSGDTYTLHYSATIPAGDPSGLGGYQYRLTLQGTVSAVPVPAAIWLLGSGMLGLIGFARRKAV
jgi:hypothetical protein